jgi:hypothetical protein
LPDPSTGDLVIDPEIALRAKGLDVTVSLYYSSRTQEMSEFGKSRSASLRTYVIEQDNIATIYRGNFSYTSG